MTLGTSRVQWKWLVRLGNGLCCLSILNGCAIGFLWHVSVGQLTLMARQQSVDEVLQAETLSAGQLAKLQLILDVRRFAMDVLGLHTDDSYTTFVDVGGPYVTYNVSAAPKDALRPYVWWFPIVGWVPYKGYFTKAKAVREATALKAEGYDTYVRGVRAYSTIGYFDDPILSSMLAYSDFSLVNTIIHELVHRTVWVKGSVSFNESLASFVADKGVLAYLAQRDGQDTVTYRDYLALRADAKRLQAYMQQAVVRLEHLYAGSLSRAEKLKQREQIFTAIVSDYPLVLAQMKTTRYHRYFERRSINNAVLLSFRRYNQDMVFFERAYVEHGESLRRLIAFFKTLEADDIPEVFHTR